MGSEILLLESFIPSQEAFINAMIFMILLIGFIKIVTLNKKYRYMFDYLEQFF